MNFSRLMEMIILVILFFCETAMSTWYICDESKIMVKASFFHFTGTLVGPTWVSMSSGALARIWAVTLVSPLELIRTKMQSQKMALSQVRDVLRLTVKSQGVLGLWRGYSATLLRDVPFSAIYWPCYELLRPQRYNFFETFLAGAFAGSVASAVTLPMDVVKTRLQVILGLDFFWMFALTS